MQLALIFHCAPEEVYEKWDKVWLDRTRVILEGRRLATIDHDKKLSADGN